MGNPKQKWTTEEEDALRAGVDKHGVGKWKNIQRDPEFGQCLAARSNIDLKDKWRNMSVSASGQGSRAPKLKALPPIPVSNVHSTSSTVVATSSTAVAQDAPADTDSSKSLLDGKNAPRYNAMIFEALTSLKDPNGSDSGAILSFIEQRHQVPPNIKRLLSSKLRRLVAQNKLEKVQNCYKIKKDSSFGTKTPTPKQKDVRPRQSQNPIFNYSYNSEEEAAVAAAYKIAEAENKAFLLSEAIKEAERISKMAEDADALVELANEILNRCSMGEVVVMA